MNYNTDENSNNPYDNGPEEPELCKMIGFDDCERCYYRLSTIERLTNITKELQGGSV